MIINAADDDVTGSFIGSVGQSTTTREVVRLTQAAHMRQVSSVLKILAVLIAPRSSSAERPVVITTHNS